MSRRCGCLTAALGLALGLMPTGGRSDAAPAAVVAERHSNGLGGGRWSDPGTWHGGDIPAATDHVVITASDTVEFDAGLSDAPNCAALSIDPDGALTFRLDGGAHRLTVAGPIESYGAIRLDASRDRDSRATLRLSAVEPERRVIRLLRGSALLIYGSTLGASDAAHIALEAFAGAGAAVGTIEAEGDVMLDLQQVTVRGFQVRATGIDNTGFRAAQRLNLVNNRFLDGARVALTQCDTAVIKGNRFHYAAQPPWPEPAISLDRCSLTACRDNTIAGYAQGIDARSDIDAAIQGNRISGAQTGISLRTGQNVMVRDNRLEDCVTGLFVDQASGVVEDLQLERFSLGIEVRRATMQFANVRLGEGLEAAASMRLHESTVTLLNCNLPAASIQLDGRSPPGDFWVQSMMYLVVRVTGKVPPRAVVQVRTADVSGGAPAGMADLNVRNAPARLSETGWTPFPRTLRPLVLRAWRIDANRELRDAPFYDLEVIPVVDAADQAPGVLHRQVVEPRDGWFRAQPNALEATLEVKIP